MTNTHRHTDHAVCDISLCLPLLAVLATLANNQLLMVATVRIAAEHESFNRICHVTPRKTQLIRGSLAYVSLLPLPRAKRHLDRFSRFCRARGRDQHTVRPRTPSIEICINSPHLAQQLLVLAMLASDCRGVSSVTRVDQRTRWRWRMMTSRSDVCH